MFASWLEEFLGFELVHGYNFGLLLTCAILELQTEEQTGVEGAVLAFNHTRGYHYNLPSNDPLSVRLPNNCIQVVRNRSSISFTTRDLIKYNGERLGEVIESNCFAKCLSLFFTLRICQIKILFISIKKFRPFGAIGKRDSFEE